MRTTQKRTGADGGERHSLPSRHMCHGFSLVELLVVVAIVGIIAGFGTPALLSMKAKSSVRADARDVYSTFRHAQSEAVKRSESICILFNVPSAGEYTVFLDNGAGGGTANNALRETGETILSVNRLRPGSSFAGIDFNGSNPGFTARGLPLANKIGSVEIHGSALKMKLSLSNAGFIKSRTL